MGTVQNDSFGKYLKQLNKTEIEKMTPKELKDVSKELLQKINYVGVQTLSLTDKNSVIQLLSRMSDITKNPDKNLLGKLWHRIIGGDWLEAKKARAAVAKELGKARPPAESSPDPVAQSSIRQSSYIHFSPQDSNGVLIKKAIAICAQYTPSVNVEGKAKRLESFLAQTDDEGTKKTIREIFNGSGK